MTKNTMDTDSIERGQDILTVIGEELNETEIKKMLNE